VPQPVQPPAYDPAHYASLSAAGERHFWFHHRNVLLAGLVRDTARRIGRPCRLLEVGCGAGNVLAGLAWRVPEVALVGLDQHPEGLTAARRLVSCPLVLGDLGRLPFRAAFEMVALFDVIEHCDDDLAALQQAQGSLAPDGFLMVTVPANPKLWSVVDEAAGHRRRYRPEDLEALLQRAGLEAVYLTHFMAPLYPAVRLARALARHRHPQQIVAVELRVRPFLNALLRWLLWPERLALARRWRLPLGSSLVALARRKA